MRKIIFSACLILLGFISGKAGAQILTLDSCKALAQRNNYKLKIAANEVIQSEQLKKSAFTNYFPKVNAMAAAVKMDDYLIKSSIPSMNLPVYDGNPANIPLATQFTYVPEIPLNMFDYMNVASVTVTQPVFAGGQIYYGNKLAKTGIEISKEKQSMTDIEVMVTTEEYFWNGIALTNNLKTLDSYIGLLENLQKDASASLDAGLINRTDLLKVQIKLNELQLNRRKLTDGISLNMMALCQHLGIKYDTSLVLADLIPEPDYSSIAVTDPETAVKNRSEYRMLDNVVTVEKLQKKMETGKRLPSVAVGASGFYFDALDNDNTNALVFATISVPITDWWSGIHQNREKKLKIEDAEYNLKETSELLVIQINKLKKELDQSYFQIQNTQRSKEASEENLKITTDNYNAGITRMSDLLDAQSVYQSALTNVIEAKCNYQIARAKYLQAVNGYE